MAELLIERIANLYDTLDGKETLIYYECEHAEYDIILAFVKCAPRLTSRLVIALGAPSC
jgi:hypothetical protein